MIKALILARSGSKRVKNKNICPFANSNLLEIKIRQLKRLPELDGVIVNSNSDEILEVAENAGAEIVKRDEYFATDSISPNELYVNVSEHFDADDVLFTNCTTPLVDDATYSKAIQLYYNLPKEYDSLITVNPLKEFLLFNGKPLNYDGAHKPRSQDLPENYALLNHVIHILPRDLMHGLGDIIGRNAFLFPISKVESVDIDDILDFEFAEFLYKKQHNII